MQKSAPREYSNSEMKQLIAEYIHNEKDQRMLFYRLVKGKTFSEIAAVVEMDGKTVRKRIHKGEEVLFAHLPG